MSLKQSYDKTAIKQRAAHLYQTQGRMKAARYLASTLFYGITDGDKPYIGHLTRVTNNITNARIKPVGYLHDLLEMIPGWTMQDVRDIGFDDYDIAGLDAVTKRKGELYFDFIERSSMSQQGVDIKLADLIDNSNFLRIPKRNLNKKEDIEQKRKYFIAYHYLKDVQDGVIEPATPVAEWLRTQPPEMQRESWSLILKHSSAYKNRPAPAPQDPRRDLGL